MGFLPTGYEAPKASSSYMRFEEGKNRFRVVSDAVFGFEYWTQDNKPVRLKEMPKEAPKDIRDDSAIKHFWAFVVIDRKDLSGVKILEITQGGIMRSMESLLADAEWGDPKGYDLTISRTGKGLETRYETMPNPHKELDKEEKELIKNTKVKLEALFYGENPFDEKWQAPAKIVEPDEVKIEDVPF